MFEFKKPEDSLNSRYRRLSISYQDTKQLKAAYTSLYAKLAEAEKDDDHGTEENIKNIIKEFLQALGFANGKHHISIPDKIDLAIHEEDKASSAISVLIEVKRPGNPEFPNYLRKDFNTKAIHECLRYYLRERKKGNNRIRNLVITNGREYYLMDEKWFHDYANKDRELLKDFERYETEHSTKDFYKEVAKPFFERAAAKQAIPVTYLNLDDYQYPVSKIAEDGSTPNEHSKEVATLFKFLSPTHWVGKAILNDANSLNKDFYFELLHIMGLREEKVKNINLIKRLPEKDRHQGSLLELTMAWIDGRKRLHKTNNPQFDSLGYDDKLFAVALELVITWVNRVLFLKLLEARLYSINRRRDIGEDFKFLNINMIKDFDQLETLFFEVLAVKQGERNRNRVAEYMHIPYLNSDLFEQTELEESVMELSNLDDHTALQTFKATVLKDNEGKKTNKEIYTLEYLFRFLDAYDFGSDSVVEIKPVSKTLINAAVLGLIFEKINGYKDGSIFTPSSITMYMCEESIRQTILDKFSERFNTPFNDFNTLYNYLARNNVDLNLCNNIVNSIKICDPSVGSGHFLVSALNELIACKSELMILTDIDGKLLAGYEIHIENDELICIERDSKSPIKYEATEVGDISDSATRLQKTLFNEKKQLIENCLFGVDINPNSIKIARLRLWIELLKNSYYTNLANNEMDTLPNIDMNIKVGDSILSRFSLTEDLSSIFKQQQFSYQSYLNAVTAYKRAPGIEAKNELRDFIKKIKEEFKTRIMNNDPRKKKRNDLWGKLNLLLNKGNLLFEEAMPYGDDQKGKGDKRIAELENDLKRLDQELEDEQNNRKFVNAFEWRFEYPEVLDENGNYLGFDLMIGNPPYIQMQREGGKLATLYDNRGYKTFERTGDIYSLFYERGLQLIKPGAYLCFITSNKWMRASYGESTRKFIAGYTPLKLIDLGSGIFDSATVDTNILFMQNKLSENTNYQLKALDLSQVKVVEHFAVFKDQWKNISNIGKDPWLIEDSTVAGLKAKIVEKGKALKDWEVEINYGIKTGFNEAFIIDTATKERLCKEDPKSVEIFKPILRGRDIKRYKADWQGLWLINTYTSYKDKDKKIVKGVDIEQYPAVKRHLDKFIESIKPRADQGETYYHLRQCAYIETFAKEKIIYPGMTKYMPFLMDNKGYFTNDKGFIMTGKSLYYLCAIFNSKLFKFTFRDLFPELQGGTRELRKVFFETAAIKEVSAKDESNFKKIVLKVSALPINSPERIELENLIDEMIYRHYGLNDEEIALVESNIPDFAKNNTYPTEEESTED